MDEDFSEIVVIYAEDEDMFRDIASMSLLDMNIPEENLELVEHGGEALAAIERIQSTRSRATPIIVLLDVNMPVMDGMMCAKKVKERVKSGQLAWEPFLVCCSSGKFVNPEEGANFHVTMEKIFSKGQLSKVLAEGVSWCRKQASAAGVSPGSTKGSGSSSAAGGGYAAPSAGAVQGGYAPPSAGAVQAPRVENVSERPKIMIAADEPTCSAALAAYLSMLDDEEPAEADTLEDTLTALTEAQTESPSAPLLLFVGNPAWLKQIQAGRFEARPPFLVNASVEDHLAGFNANLPKNYRQSDVERVIKECQEWYQKRRK
eukprot:TRINITY_DN16713_c0_g1_i2.p1 TRINITY_DN16713_c0_g1~~TRINITY_DN16713_c0_g1_i2.p1  ORF type:complete len:317 (-),score=68.35 TRINITY_DN16713_c0_g1_i2:81-1031(-)